MKLMSREAYRDIIQRLMEMSNPTKRDVDYVKVKAAGKHSLGKVPSNSEIIRHLKPEESAKLISILRRKTVRTISGVTVVAVMTKPSPCPQEEPCAYCPGGPSAGVPQSYTGHEPAAMRGAQNEYNPYAQVRTRIEQLEAIGHNVDKVELIIMGGTFPSTPPEYQKDFVKQCLDAIAERKSRSLEEAKKLAETSRVRNVGITVETRPDWAKEEHVDRMLSMGVTRVEVGVQNVYDDIYKRVNRGHRVQDVIEATRIMKDAGLKVVYHLMPGLPGSSFERDLEAVKEEASGGTELFISAEDPVNDVLVGYVRLRVPSALATRPEIVPEKTAIVRELRVYGPLVPVGTHQAEAWQHKGYGGILLSEAERAANEDYSRTKIVITSALGTKQYYKRFGYDYDGPYVSKQLS